MVATNGLQYSGSAGKYLSNSKSFTMEFDILPSHNHHCVYASNGEPSCGKSCQAHMQCFGKPGIIKHRIYRIYIEISTIGILKSSRAVHPCVGCYHENPGYESTHSNHHTRKPM